MGMMRSWLIVWALSFLFNCALSLPIHQQEVFQAVVECDNVNQYTTDWFLRNTLPEYRRELHATALFYTRGNSKQARELACRSKDLVSLWDIWPRWLYNSKATPDNRLRCIHDDPSKVRTFYENMSQAYARMARREATVMHSISDYADPPLDGIWGMIELPALRDQTDIISMKKISVDYSQSTIWQIPGKASRTVYEMAMQEVRNLFRVAAQRTLGAASVDGGSCGLWDSDEDAYLDSLW